MAAENSHRIDFDEWAELAVRDPRGFEERRSAAIEAFIADAPRHRQPRLRGLQWQVDQVRRTAGSHYAACMRISAMMWEAVTGHGGLIESMEALRGPAPEPGSRQSAKVLPFRRRH